MGTVKTSSPIPYLPVYNVCLCLIHTPIFSLHLRKKREAENRGWCFAKLALKIMFWIHFIKVDMIISSEISLNAWAIHETITGSFRHSLQSLFSHVIFKSVINKQASTSPQALRRTRRTPNTRSFLFWILSLYDIWLITQKWMLCWWVVRLKRTDNFK